MSLSDFNTIVSLLVLAITWLIVQPLKTAIAGLQVSLDRMTAVIEETRRAIASNDEELAHHSEKIKTLFTRLEQVEDRLQRVETKCERCHCRGGEQ